MIKVTTKLAEKRENRFQIYIQILLRERREMNMRELKKKLCGGLGTSQMVTKLILSLFLVLSLSSLTFSREPRGRGGPFIMLNFLNLNPINDYLTSIGVTPFDDELAIFWGCEGMSDKKKLTWGGLFVHGSLVKQQDAQRQELSINFGGPIVEYRLLEKKSFDFAFIGGLGGTWVNLTLIGDTSSKFSYASFLFHGGFKFAFKPSKKLTLKAAVGYNWVPKNSWKRKAGDLSLPGNTTLSSLHFRFGVRFGGSKSD